MKIYISEGRHGWVFTTSKGDHELDWKNHCQTCQLGELLLFIQTHNLGLEKLKFEWTRALDKAIRKDHGSFSDGQKKSPQ